MDSKLKKGLVEAWLKTDMNKGATNIRKMRKSFPDATVLEIVEAYHAAKNGENTKTKEPESGYDRKVVLCPNGDGREEVRLMEVVIPDLWHIAMRSFPEGPAREAILETWHLAHDLKKNLAGDV